MSNYHWPLLAPLLMLAACTSPHLPQVERTTETLIGELDPDGWIVSSTYASPDGRRLAYVIEQNGKQFVVLDGKEGKRYDGIGAHSSFFSPDSRRVIYSALQGGVWHMVIDGKEIGAYRAVEAPVFSPDSRRVAYKALLEHGTAVVVDGMTGKSYDGVASHSIVFSPDSRHLAFIAREETPNGDGSFFAVVDGK